MTTSRIAARLVDTLILVAFCLTLGAVVGFGFDWLVAGSAAVYAYFTLLDAAFGATAGKALFRLRVVGPDGGRPTLRQAAGREVFTLFGAIPFVGPFLAFGAWLLILAGIHRTGAGFHDRWAGGTRVVAA